MGQVLFNGLYTGAQYALIALGLTLIFALMNVLNFAHGQLYVLGGFVTYYVYGGMKLPFVVALLASALTLAVVGCLFELLFFRPVLRRSVREESTMLLSAGTAMMVESLVLIFFGEKHRGVPAVVSGVFNVGGVFIPKGRLLVIGLSCLFIAAFIIFMRYTRPGRALRAMAQDAETARLMGVNVGRYAILGWALAAMLAGLAGAMLVPISGVNAGLGQWISVKTFIMVMIGGAGAISGAILGGLALGMLESWGYYFFPGGETYLIIFVALIVFLAVRPNGLMGKAVS
ncbi:branched-chain amino acid ABC transporter permease [uncultured Fretibacterium sp.]|uniref:branched-chain amino acid ABC transporter permease n=1 Tax=uncultured Fretibacterium sp. TaxID=1678694 RepID=UPI002601F147|nr:branched-chain amino acid ABC transporter permease [uncultured Fretibacterium sp.]